MTPTQRPFELAWIPPGTAVPNPDQYVEHPEHQLDALRDSGKANMYGARPYLEQAFGFSKADANDWLWQWMETFASRHGIEGE